MIHVLFFLQVNLLVQELGTNGTQPLKRTAVLEGLDVPISTKGCGEWANVGKPSWESRTPQKYAFLPCGHLDFESAVTAQDDEFKGSFDSSSSR